MVVMRQEIAMRIAEGQKPEIPEELRGLTWRDSQTNPDYLALWENEGFLVAITDSVQIEEESDRVASAFQSCLITCPLFNGTDAQVEWAVRYKVDWRENPVHPTRRSPIITGARFAVRPIDSELPFEAFHEFTGLVRQALRRGI